jgi:hypothetical protein
MTNNTQPQLPADIENEIYKLSLEKTFMLDTDNDYQVGFKVGSEEGIRYGATAYATKLHQLGEHFEVLKISYDAALDKILACDKANAALEEKVRGLGEELKLAQDAAKLMTNKNNECQAKLWDAYRENEKAHDLLKSIINVCGDVLIHRTAIANEIKTFLDGTK